MREALAMMHMQWLTARSYRLQMVLSLATLLLALVPVYFIGRALDPTMAASISREGGDYFGFLVLGVAVLPLVSAAAGTLPAAIAGGIGTGTLESLLGTPIRLPALVAGLCGYSLLWGALRAVLVVLLGVLLGMHVAWGQVALSAVIVALTVLAYLPVGLVAASLVLRFRTAAELPRLAVYASVFLGGVYYPTGAIPTWIRHLADLVPISFGLRALRRVLLQGAALPAVVGDILALVLFAAVTTAIGVLALRSALRHVRQAGTTAQY
ncbi:MAG: ABC transporter permease [Gemmatimonadaceae bacterium]